MSLESKHCAGCFWLAETWIEMQGENYCVPCFQILLRFMAEMEGLRA